MKIQIKSNQFMYGMYTVYPFTIWIYFIGTQIGMHSNNSILDMWGCVL